MTRWGLRWTGPLLLAAAGALPTPAATPAAMLEQGNERYEAGDYAGAIEQYQYILQYRVRNAAVYYNLGNAAFKAGALGEAIRNYERARRLRPRDRDIRENLEFARFQIVDKIEGGAPGGVGALLRRIYDLHSLNGWAVWFAGLFVAAAGAAFPLIFLRDPFGRRLCLYALACLGLAWLLVGGLFLTRLNREVWQTHAVVLTPKAEVTSGPGEEYTSLFAVHEGTTMQVHQTRGAWSQVSLPNGYSGWVPAETIGVI